MEGGGVGVGMKVRVGWRDGEWGRKVRVGGRERDWEGGRERE